MFYKFSSAPPAESRAYAGLGPILSNARIAIVRSRWYKAFRSAVIKINEKTGRSEKGTSSK
ncbi:MAG: hypothetical protein C5B53_06765 [Candidatus Melainabacteria bacterium]|nr:MAG: hypothetical protein C5B53_06765 [Candidatus Melainabacteria bacterium]